MVTTNIISTNSASKMIPIPQMLMWHPFFFTGGNQRAAHRMGSLHFGLHDICQTVNKECQAERSQAAKFFREKACVLTSCMS